MIAYPIKNRIISQIISIRRCFGQIDGLPFNNILSVDFVQQILQEEIKIFRETQQMKIFTFEKFLSAKRGRC